MDRYGPKHVELTPEHQKTISAATLCVSLECIYIVNGVVLVPSLITNLESQDASLTQVMFRRDAPVHIMTYGRVKVQHHDMVLDRGKVVCFMSQSL